MRRQTEEQFQKMIGERLAYHLDRKRYMVWSGSKTLPLYYIVESDCWAYTHPASATLFKRRKMALAVKWCLSDGAKITPVLVDAKGRLILKSLKYRRRRYRRSAPEQMQEPVNSKSEGDS